MKIENIPADIKSKSLKEARDEINEILVNLETKNLDLSNAENAYKRLLNLNKHVENLFKIKFQHVLKNHFMLKPVFALFSCQRGAHIEAQINPKYAKIAQKSVGLQ